jgi:hypothetical protein
VGLSSGKYFSIVRDVPPVDRNVALVAAADRLVVIGVLEQQIAPPGVSEVILRPGAERGWKFFPVHEKLFIAFSPPPAARVPDMQRDPAEAARPVGLQQGPVYFAAFGFRRRKRAHVPFGVKPSERACGLDDWRIIQSETDGPGFLSLVGEPDHRAPFKGHVPEAVKALVRHAEGQGTCRD